MIHSYRLSTCFVLFAALLVTGGQPGRVLAAEASIAAAEPGTAAKPSLRVVEVPVEGMGCFSCAANIKHAVKSLTGVLRVEVSLEKRNARVTYLANIVTPDQIVTAIDKLGYIAGMPQDAP